MDTETVCGNKSINVGQQIAILFSDNTTANIVPTCAIFPPANQLYLTGLSIQLLCLRLPILLPLLSFKVDWHLNPDHWPTKDHLIKMVVDKITDRGRATGSLIAGEGRRERANKRPFRKGLRISCLPLHIATDIFSGQAADVSFILVLSSTDEEVCCSGGRQNGLVNFSFLN